MFHPLDQYISGRECSGVQYRDVSLPLPVAALTAVFAPIHFSSSEATASSSPSRSPLPAPHRFPQACPCQPSAAQQLNYRLADKAPASNRHRIYPGFLASLLAFRRQLGVLEVFPLVGCCHTLFPGNGKLNHVD